MQIRLVIVFFSCINNFKCYNNSRSGGKMKKEKINVKYVKRGALALCLAGALLFTAGCDELRERETNPAPISKEYSNPSKFYKFIVQNGEAVKIYKSKNIYLLFNKNDYKLTEVIYGSMFEFLGTNYGAEIYDLESETLLAYSDGIATSYNDSYAENLIRNNYHVCLSNVNDYVEGEPAKEYFTLDEIRELEPKILESLKIINEAKRNNK